MTTRGDESAFVDENRALVRGLVSKLCRQYGISGMEDDLEAAGLKGLLEAFRRYNPERGTKASTFAYYRVRGAILDEIRRMSHLPRRLHRRLQAAQVADRFAEDLSERRGTTTLDREAAVAEIRDFVHLYTTNFTATLLAAPDEPEALDPEEELLRRERQSKLRACVETLPDRERKLVEGVYFQGREMQVVAAELGVSKSWGSRLHARALRLLRTAMSEPSRGSAPDLPLPRQPST